ncbi:TIGR03088 family PEP-CTERM/XrtA system glycosyltransferase [Parahaliea sp. F7430]|uniref:TIGR03088 family PEP-CTERM/XrtA system glycosyltransferase n=1 Tax=Sediminihaliea albiluteola TaxID=2758564 RepID=A0A7W2TVK8_9GAMM|nr:TIGR03088 family PEP-CTERM/XrtA system glycosyltransferase [Sediminihaliea albiluteola]MBA6412706.1 TIGR03088 family PEP-CTERM/XrtA system glycosyltransferase [Sediminihaliea albiluteola]
MSGSDTRPPLVLHIIYALGTGGLENGLVHLINGTPKERYRHAIVCLTQADAFGQRITAPGVEVYELNMRAGRDWSAYRRLWKLLRQLRPAIVHSRNLAALEAQLVTLFGPKLRRVHGEHGRDMSDLEGTNYKYRLLRKAMRYLIHRYIAVSRDLSTWLVDYIGVRPDRLRQIYNGVDQSRFHPLLADQNRESLFPKDFLAHKRSLIVGAVGRLAEVKNQRSLLQALARILEINPDLRDTLRLVIVGEGPMRHSLQSLAEELNIAQLLFLTGDRSDVAELLRAMDVFVLPSLAEGVSNTLLEAMASGLPVIATRVGGNPELVSDEDNGLLVPVDDSEALAQAILRLIDSAQLRQQMGQSGTRFVRENFSWPQTVAQYLALYDELLAVG